MNNQSEIYEVLIVDDHPLLCLGLKTLLQDQESLKVVGQAGTGAEALEKARSLKPRVVILDVRLPDADGIEICRKLKQMEKPPAVVILTSVSDDTTVLAAIEAGADGYLVKQLENQNLGESVLETARGGSLWIPSSPDA